MTAPVDEAYRYFKEISKDGVSLALSNAEHAEGRLYDFIHGGGGDAMVAFYAERYGAEAADRMRELCAVEADYAGARARGEGVALAASALRLKDIVLARGFAARVQELAPGGALPAELLTAQPLWF